MIKYYQENRGDKKSLRPRPQSIYDHALSIITIDFNPPDVADTTTEGNIRSATSNEPTISIINHGQQIQPTTPTAMNR